jgi:uncharacterized membrane protein
MASLELILAVYPDPDRAPDVLKVLQRQIADKSLQVRDAAAICRDAQGRTTISEPFDVSAGQGSLFGAIVGGVVGLLGGPAGMVVGAVAGAATGGLVAKGTDQGFEDRFLGEIKAALQPGSSALLALVEEPWSQALVEALSEPRMRLLRNVLKEDVIKRLTEK